MKKVLRTAAFSLCLTFPLISFSQKIDTLSLQNGRDIIQEGITLYDDQEYEEALHVFEKVHPADSNYSWAMLEKAKALDALEAYEKGISFLEEYTKELSSNSGSLLVLLGNMYDKNEQPQKALATYDRAIEISPLKASLYYNKAITLDGMGRKQEAFEALKKCFERNPYYASGHLLMANWALAQGEQVPAVLAYATYFMFERGTERSYNVLVEVNGALSEKGKIKPQAVDFGEGDAFKKSELLISNYVALSEKYDVGIKKAPAIVKQTHLTLSNLQTGEGYISEFYIPFYKELMKDEDRFESLGYLIMLMSRNEDHQKQINANVPKIKDFIQWAENEWATSHQDYKDTLNGEEGTYRHYFRDNHPSIYLVAKSNPENGEPMGFGRYYSTVGHLAGYGHFDKDGKREGLWRFFWNNGKIHEELSYKNGSREGVSKIFDLQGRIEIVQNYVDDELNGERKIYFPNGQVQTKSHYEDGVLQKEYIEYNQVGSRIFKAQVKDGKRNGLSEHFYANGKLKEKGNYVNGEVEGVLEVYHSNGQLMYKAQYTNGMLNDDYKEYDRQGNLIAEGKKVEGKKVGVWNHYHSDGTLEEVGRFDESGKESGAYQYFDNEGKLLHESLFSKGNIIGIKCFDEKGEVTYQDKSKRGSFEYHAKYRNGADMVKGEFNKGAKTGDWFYYDFYGNLESKERFVEGALDGVDTAFYPNGKVQSISPYENGIREGVYSQYYPDGSLHVYGNFRNGQKFGPWFTLSLDGTVVEKEYFLNGEYHGKNYYYNYEGKPVREMVYDNGMVAGFTYFDGEGNITGTGVLKDSVEILSWKYKNGNIAQETHVYRGMYHGSAKWFYPTGQTRVSGEFHNGYDNGKWTYYYLNGQISQEGIYEHGERQGEWKFYHKNGQLSETLNYVNGLYTGESIEYHEDGSKERVFNYYEGDYHGRQEFYGAGGVLQLIRYYHFGELVGYAYLENGEEVPMIPIVKGTAEVKSFYSEGPVSRTFSYKNGYFDGAYKVFYKDGKIAEDQMFEFGRAVGVDKTFYANGNPKYSGQHELGNRQGEWLYYHENGKVKMKENYLQGSLEGEVQYFDGQGNLEKTEIWFDGVLYEIK